MANKISKRDNIMYNDVSDQRLTYANQLTIKAWNDIINVLKTQANINAAYLSTIHKWLLGSGDNDITLNTDKSFVEHIIDDFATHTWALEKFYTKDEVYNKNETYSRTEVYTTDEAIALGLIHITEYNEDTGELTLAYNSKLMDVSYDNVTGNLKFEYKDNGETTEKTFKISDTDFDNFVHRTGNESIEGVKTFKSHIYINTGTPYVISQKPGYVGMRTVDENHNTVGQIAISASSPEEYEGQVVKGFCTGNDGEYYGFEFSKKGPFFRSGTFTKELATKEYVNSLSRLAYKIVEYLPEGENISLNTIYLIKSKPTADNNTYIEYMYVDGNWEVIGTTDVNLSNYVDLTSTQTITGQKAFNTIYANTVGHFGSTSAFSFNDEGTPTIRNKNGSYFCFMDDSDGEYAGDTFVYTLPYQSGIIALTDDIPDNIYKFEDSFEDYNTFAAACIDHYKQTIGSNNICFGKIVSSVLNGKSTSNIIGVVGSSTRKGQNNTVITSHKVTLISSNGVIGTSNGTTTITHSIPSTVSGTLALTDDIPDTYTKTELDTNFVKYDSNGYFTVKSPSVSMHPTNKTYVDSNIASKVNEGIRNLEATLPNKYAPLGATHANMVEGKMIDSVFVTQIASNYLASTDVNTNTGNPYYSYVNKTLDKNLTILKIEAAGPSHITNSVLDISHYYDHNTGLINITIKTNVQYAVGGVGVTVEYGKAVAGSASNFYVDTDTGIVYLYSQGQYVSINDLKNNSTVMFKENQDFHTLKSTAAGGNESTVSATGLYEFKSVGYNELYVLAYLDVHDTRVTNKEGVNVLKTIMVPIMGTGEQTITDYAKVEFRPLSGTQAGSGLVTIVNTSPLYQVAYRRIL